MKPSDDLFQLIQSMTRAEKRRFKLMAARHGGEKQYLRLFDAIAAQTVYDEQELRVRFEGERFLRQLNVAKRYLYDLILESLRTIHSERSASASTRDLIMTAALLYDRGLSAQATKQIDRAISLARVYEDHFALAEALYWQGRVDPRQLRTADGVRENFEAIFSTLDALRQSLDYEHILFQLRMVLRNDVPQTEEERIEADRLVSLLPPPDAVDRFLSLDAQKWAYTAYYLHAVGMGDFRAAYDHISYLVDLFEHNPIYLRENLNAYQMVLHNLAAVHRMLNDYEGLESTIERMRAALNIVGDGPTGAHFRMDMFIGIHLHRLKELNVMGEFERAAVHEGEIREGLRRYGADLSPEMRHSFYAALAQMRFGLGDYHAALDYNNLILADPLPDIRQVRYYQARLFNLMIHYELGNYELLEHLIRSVHRYLVSRGVANRFEEIVLLFFRRLLRMRSSREFRAIAERTLADLSVSKDEPYSGMPTEDYQWFVVWLRRYVEGRSLRELRAEIYRARSESRPDAASRPSRSSNDSVAAP